MTLPTSHRDNAIATLREHGISPSEQRIAVYDFLLRNHIHPTVDTIYRRLAPDHPTLSRTTVYNTLKLLAEKDLVLVLTIENGELRYDGNTTPHAHFKCNACDGIWDFFNVANPNPPDDCGEGFVFTSTQVNFYGTCPHCKNAITHLQKATS